MRKFKFVGTEEERLDYSSYESQRPVYGKVYDEYHVVGGFNPLDWINDRLYGHEWKEVFDTIEDKITELKEMAKSQGMDCKVVLKDAPKKLEVIASGYDVNHYPNHSCFRVEFFIYNDNIRDYSNKEIANFLAKQLETYLNDEKK